MQKMQGMSKIAKKEKGKKGEKEGKGKNAETGKEIKRKLETIFPTQNNVFAFVQHLLLYAQILCLLVLQCSLLPCIDLNNPTSA